MYEAIKTIIQRLMLLHNNNVFFLIILVLHVLSLHINRNVLLEQIEFQ